MDFHTGAGVQSKRHKPCGADLLPYCRFSYIKLQRALYEHTVRPFAYVFAEGPFLAMLIFDLRSWLLSPGVRSDMTCVVSETESQCTTQTEDRISTLYQE